MNLSSKLLKHVKAFTASGADRFPDDLALSLKEDGYFSMLLPGNLGGPCPTFPEYVETVRQLANANGSVGWCVNQGSVLASLTRLLPAQAAATVVTSATTTIANGPPRQSQSIPASGGYELTGSWHFSSGIAQADWLVGMAMVTKPDNKPSMLWHFFPKDQATIGSDWNVQGLRATQSYDFTVNNLFIPAELAVEPRVRQDDEAIYQIPLNLMFAGGFAAVAVGVARAALDAASERATVKVKRFEKKTLSEDTMTQDQIGKAMAICCAAESYLEKTVADVWQAITDSGCCDDNHRMKLRLATTHVIRESRNVSNIAWDLCSTDSIFADDAVHRLFQDSHVISQHLQGRPEVYGLAGRHQLGLPVASVLL